ncbi:MAG: hypothetical protein K2P80_05185 [Beijerinckiaceae bacterium]|nr:hypothetical protein [Beijerinckiaceae bacterium]
MRYILLGGAGIGDGVPWLDKRRICLGNPASVFPAGDGGLRHGGVAGNIRPRSGRLVPRFSMPLSWLAGYEKKPCGARPCLSSPIFPALAAVSSGRARRRGDGRIVDNVRVDDFADDCVCRVDLDIRVGSTLREAGILRDASILREPVEQRPVRRHPVPDGLEPGRGLRVRVVAVVPLPEEQRPVVGGARRTYLYSDARLGVAGEIPSDRVSLIIQNFHNRW